MDVRQALGVGVGCHHDVRFLGQEGLESVEKLFLGAVLVGEELHVVDQEQIERVVLLLELVEGLALVGLDHVRHELLGMDVEDLAARLVGQQLVTHSVHQVRLAQADSAINEERVVEMPWCG